MNIEKILDEVDHKVYLFCTVNKVYVQEWIRGLQKSVIRITYNRAELEKDKIYFGDNFS